MTDAKQALLPVTQSDRDAASAYDAKHNNWDPSPAWRDGTMDGSVLVQAFARHREAHPLPGMREALEKIANGIEKRMDDGTTVVDDHPDAMEIARAALTPTALS